MQRTNFILSAMILTTAASGIWTARASTSYTFTNIDVPGAVIETVPYGINDSGQIVGTYYDTGGLAHGFLLSGGTYSTIDYPGAAGTQVLGISANGQIVGTFFTVSNCGNCYGVTFPFLLSGGVYTALPEAPGSLHGTTRAWSINSSGQIVGPYTDPCFCRSHGFLLSGGTYTTIDDPGFFSSGAFGINDAGQIVGFGQQAFGGADAHGFLFNAGVFSTLDDPLVPQPESGVVGTVATGINRLGDVAGYFGPASGQSHGFLLSGGAYTTIDPPNAQTGTAAIQGNGINAGRQLVGTYTDLNGVSHGFLATPQAPAPLYHVCLLYDSTKAVNSGATLPVKLLLCDASGNDQSSATITLHATGVTQVSTSISGAVQDAGNANPDNDFRFDSTLGSTGGYIFNLSTKGLATGTYNLNFTVTGDSFPYAAPFQVK